MSHSATASSSGPCSLFGLLSGFAVKSGSKLRCTAYVDPKVCVKFGHPATFGHVSYSAGMFLLDAFSLQSDFRLLLGEMKSGFFLSQSISSSSKIFVSFFLCARHIDGATWVENILKFPSCRSCSVLHLMSILLTFGRSSGMLVAELRRPCQE